MLKRISALLYFLLLPLFSSTQPADAPPILFSKQSPFGLIEIVRNSDGDLNICENQDYSQTHSTIRKEDPTFMGAKYASFATASFCFLKNLNNILLLGLGGGEFLSYFTTYFPNTSVDIVEINPVMIEIVKDFRSLKINKQKVHFICADAFKYVSNMPKMYDLIFCDIYFFTPPIASLYEHFFEHVNKHLNPGGVFVFNVIEMPRSVVEDMFSQFEHVVMLDTQIGNIVFICYQGALKATEELQHIATQLQRQHQFRYSLSDISKQIKYITPENRNAVLAQFSNNT